MEEFDFLVFTTKKHYFCKESLQSKPSNNFENILNIIFKPNFT